MSKDRCDVGATNWISGAAKPYRLAYNRGERGIPYERKKKMGYKKIYILLIGQVCFHFLYSHVCSVKNGNKKVLVSRLIYFLKCGIRTVQNDDDKYKLFNKVEGNGEAYLAIKSILFFLPRKKGVSSPVERWTYRLMSVKLLVSPQRSNKSTPTEQQIYQRVRYWIN